MKKEELLRIIYDSLDQINDQFSLDIKKEEQSKLIGEIDSFVLVNLLAAIESKLDNITIATDKAMGYNSPFRNIGTLADFILEL